MQLRNSEKKIYIFFIKAKKKLICKRWIVNWTFFCVIGVCLFSLLQRVLMPVWHWPQLNDNPSWVIDEFNSLDRDSIDVVFVGTSHVQCGISPMEIYKEYGINSYSLASSGQSLDITYLLLEEMFKTQNPSYIVLDASSIFFSEEDFKSFDSQRRNVLDLLPLSINKIEAAEVYSGQSLKELSEKDITERFNSVIFPIISYHTNWKNLYDSNFTFGTADNYCTAGYEIYVNKAAAYTDIDDMNSTADLMRNDNIQHSVSINTNREIETIEDESPYTTAYIEDFEREYVKNIKELCEKNNSKLLLIKIPTIGYLYNYSSSWTEEKYELTRSFASEIGVDYFDLLYDANIELDFTNDFVDAGSHLNYLGAVKASQCLGDYLSNSCGIGGKSSSYMDENMESYDKLTSIAKLQLEDDFLNYAQLLQENSDDYIVCISVKEYWKKALLENDIAALNTLGLYDDIQEYTDLGNSYVAVVDGGTVEHEEVSNRKILHDYEIDEDNSVKLVSAGAYGGNTAEIYFNHIQVAMNGRGLNIVVIDKSTKKILDSCYIDTNVEGGHLLAHSGNCYNYMFDIVYGDN